MRRKAIYMKTIIIIFITVLCTSVGCHNKRIVTHKGETQTIPSQDLILKYGILEEDREIKVLIYNISDENLYIEVPVPGLGFDLEYLSTNNTAIWLQGMSKGILVYPLNAFHVLEPAPKDIIDMGFVIDPYFTLPLTIRFIPDDLLKIRRIECRIRYIKISDFIKIKNKENFHDILHHNTINLRVVAPGLIPGEDVYDTKNHNSFRLIDPIRSPQLRGTLR